MQINDRSVHSRARRWRIVGGDAGDRVEIRSAAMPGDLASKAMPDRSIGRPFRRKRLFGDGGGDAEKDEEMIGRAMP
jgi:hypothetical protein